MSCSEGSTLVLSRALLFGKEGARTAERERARTAERVSF